MADLEAQYWRLRRVVRELTDLVGGLAGLIAAGGVYYLIPHWNWGWPDWAVFTAAFVVYFAVSRGISRSRHLNLDA